MYKWWHTTLMKGEKMSCKRVGTKNGLGHYNIVIECGYDINGDRIRIRRQF